jgi:DNA-binding LytR/AlgR family response regulator
MPARDGAILIVEDEWLVASTLAERLRELGHEVSGPAPTVASALQLVADRMPAAALLDVALGTENSFAVATMLRRQGVPFVFLTGYLNVDLPAEFAGETVLGKPVGDSELEATLGRLLGRA